MKNPNGLTVGLCVSLVAVMAILAGVHCVWFDRRTTEAVVSTAKLPVGHRITATDLDTTRVTVGAAAGAASDPSDLEGRIVTAVIGSGKPILTSSTDALVPLPVPEGADVRAKVDAPAGTTEIITAVRVIAAPRAAVDEAIVIDRAHLQTTSGGQWLLLTSDDRDALLEIVERAELTIEANGRKP